MVNFLKCCFVFLVKFSNWSNFHVIIITVSGVMIILFYKGLFRNLEIGNTPVWISPNFLRLGQVRDTKFGTDVSNKVLLMLQTSRVIAVTVSELLRENRRGVKLPPSSPQIRVKHSSFQSRNDKKRLKGFHWEGKKNKFLIRLSKLNPQKTHSQKSSTW